MDYNMGTKFSTRNFVDLAMVPRYHYYCKSHAGYLGTYYMYSCRYLHVDTVYMCMWIYIFVDRTATQVLILERVRSKSIQYPVSGKGKFWDTATTR